MDTMHAMPPLVVSSEHAAWCFTAEWIRNRLAASPGATVVLPTRKAAPWLHRWWDEGSHPPGIIREYGAQDELAEGDLAVVGPFHRVRTTISCRDALILPGTDPGDVSARETLLRLALGEPESTTVILVPGTGQGPRHEVTPASTERLRRAESLTQCGGIRCVLLSGWGGPDNQLSEAVQLLRRWAGPPTTLIADPAARTTAENGLCCAALLSALPDVREVRIVSSWSNALRQHLLALAAFRGSGVRVRSSVLWGRPHAGSLRPGITGLTKMGRHLRAGRQLLRLGALDPRAAP